MNPTNPITPLPAPAPKISHSLLWLIVIVIICSGAYILWKFSPLRSVSTIFSTNYREGVSSYDSGDIENAILNLEQARSAAVTEAGRASATIRLAHSLFLRNQGNDRSEAVSLYKSIINDEKVPSVQRALAINNLIDKWNGTDDEELALGLIFTGDWASLAPNGDVELGVRRLYEKSFAFSPFPESALRIANWYAGQLRLDYSPSEKEALLSQLTAWTQIGESLLESPSQAELPVSLRGYHHLLLAQDLRAIAHATDKNYSRAEEAYKKSIEIITPHTRSVDTFSLNFYIRLHYAAMLAEVYGADRRVEIESILASAIAEPPSEFRNHTFLFYEFLKNETSHDHDTHGHKQDILRLAQLVPEFKSFLDSRDIIYD